jgi:hypothetical protein
MRAILIIKLFLKLHFLKSRKSENSLRENSFEQITFRDFAVRNQYSAFIRPPRALPQLNIKFHSLFFEQKFANALYPFPSFRVYSKIHFSAPHKKPKERASQILFFVLA